MDFSFSEEQSLFRESVRDFVEREVRPAAREIDIQDAFPWALFKRCAELGFFGLRYPESIGGAGADALTFTLLIEELARGSLALAAIVGMQCLNATDILFQLGTADQQKRLLIPALGGEKIGTIAITEPDSGSDIGGIRAAARKSKGGWVLSGTKTWITSASVADFFIVAAKTDPKQRSKGIALFLVEKDTSGLSVSRRIEKLGTRGSETSELFLDDVEIPLDQLLGKEGTGLQVLRSTLAEIRTMTAALGVGLAQAALEDSLQYAGDRRQFDRPIGSFQAISHKLAKMGTDLEAARWLLYRSAWGISRNESDSKLSAMAKYFASEVANQAADQATRIFGSYGFSMEYDAQRYFRDARFLLYGAGTSEILLTLIAKQMGVGKQRE